MPLFADTYAITLLSSLLDAITLRYIYATDALIVTPIFRCLPLSFRHASHDYATLCHDYDKTLRRCRYFSASWLH